MKNYSLVLIVISSLLLFCLPGLASPFSENEEVLSSTYSSAEELKEVVPCNAHTTPLLYYIPVDEMQCEVPSGYGIDFEGTLEMESKEAVNRTEQQLTLFAILLGGLF